jgi:hypothetical protein
MVPDGLESAPTHAGNNGQAQSYDEFRRENQQKSGFQRTS